MNYIATTMLALAGLIGLSLAGGANAAGTGEKREAAALQHMTMTLPQAIATAEGKTGGKAFDAGVDVEHGAVRVVVETNGLHGVQTVQVDAQTGHIVGMHAGGEAD